METISKNCKGAKKDIQIYKELFIEYGISQLLLDAVKKDKRLNKGKVQSTVVKNIEKMLASSSRPPKKKKEKEEMIRFPEMEENGKNTFRSTSVSPTSRLIITDNRWVPVCAEMISDQKAKKQFIDDMEWFVNNHNESYIDKKKNIVKGYYYDHDTSNTRTLERLRMYMENKLKPNPKAPWLADIYRNIPINKIMDYMHQRYGN